ncbi:MAG TPA: DUF1223 domain-containing protein [Chthoniobacterales bacterium]|jgi:hypothetical protein
MTSGSLLLLLVALFASVSVGLAEEPLVLESKASRSHLLELYTSEGCSSCPPAEAWLSKLKDDGRLWRDVVPVAFHVDYWNRLGWRDPFSSKVWTARQYEYSAHWKTESVYTPGFVLDGKEWRDRGPLPPASGSGAGVLKIVVQNSDKVLVSFKPAEGNAGPFTIHLARLGFGLTTRVGAGENSGRTLAHDFVALGLTEEEIDAAPKEMPLVAASSGQASRPAAIAAWVTQAGQLEPLQAVGGWLP